MNTYMIYANAEKTIVNGDNWSRLASTFTPEELATVEPFIPPPPYFQPLTAWQVRKVLTQYGLRDAVESAVLASDQTTKDAWQYAGNYDRDNPILNAMAVALGITSAQLDQMFIEGKDL